MNTELDDHLGYDKHESSSNPNSRHDTSSVILRTENNLFYLDSLRDCEGTFESNQV